MPRNGPPPPGRIPPPPPPPPKKQKLRPIVVKLAPVPLQQMPEAQRVIDIAAHLVECEHKFSEATHACIHCDLTPTEVFRALKARGVTSQMSEPLVVLATPQCVHVFEPTRDACNNCGRTREQVFFSGEQPQPAKLTRRFRDLPIEPPK